MITVPVLLNYDAQKPIGYLTIDENALSDIFYLYSKLSIGYKLRDKNYELTSIGVIPDEIQKL